MRGSAYKRACVCVCVCVHVRVRLCACLGVCVCARARESVHANAQNTLNMAGDIRMKTASSSLHLRIFLRSRSTRKSCKISSIRITVGTLQNIEHWDHRRHPDRACMCVHACARVLMCTRVCKCALACAIPDVEVYPFAAENDRWKREDHQHEVKQVQRVDDVRYVHAHNAYMHAHM